MRIRTSAVALLFVLLGSSLVVAPAKAAELAIGFLSRERPPLTPVSPVDADLPDSGLDGARLAIADGNTTGRFSGHSFRLIERRIGSGDIAAGLLELAGQGVRFVTTDLDAEDLLAAADAARHADIRLINARAPDDRLRNEDCRASMLHTVPSRAQIADGLAQYLVWKRWRRWFLIVGRGEGDLEVAAALHRSAKRFGAEIVAEKRWTFQPGNARADTGHVALQSEIPVFTRAPDHDVLVVADERGEFGDYLEGRTALPRPVVGTHGIVAGGWSTMNEQWGAAQLHSRFQKLAGRRMNAADYAAWLAVRAVGEAAIRTRSSDPVVLNAYLRGPDFVLAGFKGQGLSFRDWDGQMRQPVLISTARILVSASPQPGFLHRGSELDTLGTDREESRCRM
jgi:ABC transporter substrate binding protein (PQQ-dependent alcohol dehydrogenase system)